MHNYNYIHFKWYYFMNIAQKKVVSGIMNLALMKFSLLSCGLKHTPIFKFKIAVFHCQAKAFSPCPRNAILILIFEEQSYRHFELMDNYQKETAVSVSTKVKAPN